MRTLLFIAICGWLLVSCNNNSDNNSTEKIKIVTTTGILGDAVANIVGENATVESLMGPGVDPHLYKATQRDLDKLTGADIVIYNGLFLEGKMEDILEKLGRTKKTLSVGDQLDNSRLIQTAEESEGNLGHDPHIWFDVSLWNDVVNIISSTLREFDPEHALQYEQNAKRYTDSLTNLHQWVKNEISTIPQEQRLLITSHDAFHYFGIAYDIEVRGLQGISTASDYGLQDVTELVNVIKERKVKSVFIETSVAARSLQAVVEGCKNSGYEVKIGGTLFSDAMGQPGTDEGTYVGMVQANVRTIVSALK